MFHSKIVCLAFAVLFFIVVPAGAQDLDSLLGSMGIDPETLSAAQQAMGGEANPEAARAYSEGTKAGMAGKLDVSIKHLKKATELSPNFAGAHFNLACAYSKKGEKAHSLASLSRAISIDSGYKSKAKRDSDFSSMRNDAEFQRLVN